MCFRTLACLFYALLPCVLASCYYPDSTPAPGYVAFNSTANGRQSVCCDIGDICTTQQLCQGNAGYTYRGGCTDKTWESPICQILCRNGEHEHLFAFLSQVTYCGEVAQHSFSNIYPCDVIGTFSRSWCCGADESTGCCNGTTFNFDNIGGRGFLFKPENGTAATTAGIISLTTTTVSTSASAFTPSIQPSTQPPISPSTPEHPGSLTHGVAIGVGVGVPTAVLALAALAVLFVREHRRRSIAEKTAKNLIEYGARAKRRPWQNEAATEYSYEMNGRPWVQELNAAPTDPMELQSRQIHEANNGA